MGCGQRQAGAARSARPSYGAGKQNETAPTLWKFSSLPTGWRPCSTVPGACSDPHLWVTDSTHCVCTELASGSVLFEDTSGLLWRLGTRPGLLEAFWPPALGPPRPRPHPSRRLPWAPPPLLLRLLPPPPQVFSPRKINDWPRGCERWPGLGTEKGRDHRPRVRDVRVAVTLAMRECALI